LVDRAHDIKKKMGLDEKIKKKLTKVMNIYMTSLGRKIPGLGSVRKPHYKNPTAKKNATA